MIPIYSRHHEVQLANIKINKYLKNILKVTEDRLLQINPSKNLAMLFRSENSRAYLLREIGLTLGGRSIAFESCKRNLEFLIDHNLDFVII